MTHIDAEDDVEEDPTLSQEELDKLNQDFIKHPDYNHEEYIAMPIALCDVCDSEYDCGGHGCKHYYACDECSYQCPKQHYSQCIYCILDGIEWNEEWDSWIEVVSRGKNITLNGMMDVFQYGKGYKFNPHSVSHSDSTKFQELYQTGVDIADTIRYERDDELIIEEIESSM